MNYTMLQGVADALPFALDDTAQVNNAFVRWLKTGAASAERLIHLWTYCYIYRFFLIKCAPQQGQTSLAFERLVATAFADVQEHRGTIRRPECYAGWVCTVCRNTFINYLRKRRSTVSLEEGGDVVILLDAVDRAVARRDALVVYQAICAAIDELPPYMRDVARMRLLEHRPYKAIALEVGKPLPTLRAYVGRATALLRDNHTLQALIAELRD